MRHTLAALTLLVVTSPRLAAEDYPSVVIKSDKLKLTLYEPDAKKGFYRGTRFDHAGVFGNVEFAGHKIFGPWKDTHDPTNHDDIVGPCEEFGIEKPLGYDDAKVGETFLKIGVGELEKPKEAQYAFWNKYKVVKPLEWKTTEMAQKIQGGGATVRAWVTEQQVNGYGYLYRKMLLVGTGPLVTGFGIRHTLKNTGEKRLVTDFYNHNFFNVDGDPVGPDYSFVFPFDPKAKDLKGKFGELVELKDKEFRFKDKLPGGDFVMAGLIGFDPKDEKHRTFEMRHAPSGVRIAVKHDYAFMKFNVWGIKTTICPEPYLALDLKPGEETEWTIWYLFSHEPPAKK
jgi:hypothetical protein